MTPQLYNIDIPIYNDCLHVFFGSREEAITAIKESKAIPDYIAEAFRAKLDEEHANGIYLYNEATGYHLIWMPVVPEKIKHYVSLVHELQHFVFKFLDLRGFSHTDASDEAYSYLLGYTYGEVDVIINNIRDNDNTEPTKQENK